jgi:hypothetical protein
MAMSRIFAAAIDHESEHRSRMIAAHRHYGRALVAWLFVLSALLVPLRAVFACTMTKAVVEHCCCDHACEDGCAAEQAAAERCCDAYFLPDAESNCLLATIGKAAAGWQQVDLDLPPILPPREVSPDPPAISDVALHTYISFPLAWLQGSDTYLLTLRLRN